MPLCDVLFQERTVFMDASELLKALHVAERLKDATRRMCLIHDLGECFTGDIPTFLKTASDEKREDDLLADWVSGLPEPFRKEMADLYQEMNERKTLEARIFKAMDSLEALIQHNESDLSTWSENEFDLNMHYADDKVAFSPYLTELRQMIREDTEAKIEAASP